MPIAQSANCCCDFARMGAACQALNGAGATLRAQPQAAQKQYMSSTIRSNWWGLQDSKTIREWHNRRNRFVMKLVGITSAGPPSALTQGRDLSFSWF